ncbi:DUF929 family protein [Frankia sp. AgB1.9]|uniref:DUF929 family protein n=1 Tax=unclassified Frankia TaxID=2632575 RepID=UPI001931F33F|nr:MULTISPECIES: DUF929 family protein [unclassified Frankia]MBL7487524.1 DUF929 family protein [Frankia sp. AgW1.1]MBL7549495.1 DUF929 family protein [Frankia sp. AgB1.9]MBL7620716.1 DUF929 family protein [Frankia sp. AgB1.8]
MASRSPGTSRGEQARGPRAVSVPERRQARVAAMRAEQARRERQRRALWVSVTAVAVVVVVVGVLVGVKVSGGGKSTTAAPSGPASAAVVHAVTGVPAATLTTVGAGKVQTLPKPISAPALTADGKPRVLYIGAEYCPYCAAERWPMVVALSRFGTWAHLGATSSSSSDVYPSTATLSFHGATYTSDLLSFAGIEQTTNVRSGSGYTPLDTVSAADQQLLATYDVPPYVGSDSAGAIPFVDIGGRYVISGASYSPQLLAGKTHGQIAAALTDPASPVAQAIDGTANAITATLCDLTSQKPAAVCASPAISTLRGTIHADR